MTKRNNVINAINFSRPEYIPIWFFNRDCTHGDVLHYDFGLLKDDHQTSEWGYKWHNLDDGTMGQPEEAIIADWDKVSEYKFPELKAKERSAGIAQFLEKSSGHYLLGSLGISGFTTYTFVRGFSNAMVDFAMGAPHAMAFLEKIFQFEMDIISMVSDLGFDGVHFSDDWGTQTNLLISPEMWRTFFKPLYKKQFDHAHRLGLHVWFHSCGNITPIVQDFHEIGVDVMNISQPNSVNILSIGKQLKGRQCFLMPISYQTVSITGTPADIMNEADRLYENLSTREGGFMGYVEDYACMGMTEENYQACISAFRKLKSIENTRLK